MKEFLYGWFSWFSVGMFLFSALYFFITPRRVYTDNELLLQIKFYAGNIVFMLGGLIIVIVSSR
jgi:hypothetical protein